MYSVKNKKKHRSLPILPCHAPNGVRPFFPLVKVHWKQMFCTFLLELLEHKTVRIGVRYFLKISYLRKNIRVTMRTALLWRTVFLMKTVRKKFCVGVRYCKNFVLLWKLRFFEKCFCVILIWVKSKAWIKEDRRVAVELWRIGIGSMATRTYYSMSKRTLSRFIALSRQITAD